MTIDKILFVNLSKKFYRIILYSYTYYIFKFMRFTFVF